MTSKFRMLVVIVLLMTAAYHTQPKGDYREIKKGYSQLSGELFRDVQLSEIFPDSKTFVDAVPLKGHEQILELYDSVKALADFDLSGFVHANYRIPGETKTGLKLAPDRSMQKHISALWDHLLRRPEEAESLSTLVPLNYPYIVPGGRFREIYYWDSFFTMLGLLADGRTEYAENMVRNFASLIDRFGMIPNGNRIYYLTRSQPPFFALMVDMLCRYKKNNRYGVEFLPQLQAEYNFWMNGLNNIQSDSGTSERVVKLSSNTILNRYFDSDTIPREESFREDYRLSLNMPENVRPAFYRDLRAGAESGWDFSSRWFKDGRTLSAIKTTAIIPVDLNCLLYFLEDRLSFYYGISSDKEKERIYRQRADKRKELINKIFWNNQAQYYSDFDLASGSVTKNYSLAGTYPLYFGIAGKKQAEGAARQLKEKFLKAGGLVTTLVSTGQQWDAPNGWPPLQWIAVKGLREYGFDNLADSVKQRWLRLNETVYKRTGRMLEKYNVEDITLFAGGGEYPLQDGFGWTNGVALAFISNFDKTYLIKKEEK